ncbi:MAG: pentapeptide repeat-containing protein [Spirochaetales bacterium]|nr:pentapeptide repeat-containing protein [Spirochaetales bacterium]
MSFKADKFQENYELNFDNDTRPKVDPFNDKKFYTNIDFEEIDIRDVSFERCKFSSCLFNEISMADTIFTGCIFEKCSIVLARLENTTFNDVLFKGCKMIGLDFTKANDFLMTMAFDETILDNIYFFDKKIRKTNFINCRIKNSDFTRVDLSGSDFTESLFEHVTFSQCKLEKADFRSARGYQIDPETNNLKKARFTLPEAQSFLAYLGINIED